MEIGDKSLIYLGAFGVLVLVYGAIRLTARPSYAKNSLQAPFAPSLLPFGLDHVVSLAMAMINNRLIEHVDDLVDNPGRTVRINLMGKPLLFTSHPENIKSIQITQFDNFIKGKRFRSNFQNTFGGSVFSTDGAEWLRNKHDLSPFLARSRPDDLLITEKHAQRLIDRMKTGQPLDMYQAMYRYSLDIATHIWWGVSTDTQLQDRHAFKEAVDWVFRLASLRTALGPLSIFVPDFLLARKSCAIIAEHMDGRVKQVLAIPREDLLQKEEDKTINLMETLALRRPEEQYIKDQLFAVMNAGKGPIAITISWTLYQLTQHPEVYRRLEYEIGENIGFHEHPNAAALKRMKFLRCVLNETMRLYSSLAFNPRQAAVDTILPVGGGADGQSEFMIRKGQEIILFNAGAQTGKRVTNIPNPNEWIPSRWEHWQPGPAEFLAFSIGPRKCLGTAFAYQQLEYIMVRIIQEFQDVKWCGHAPGIDPNAKFGVKLEMNTKPDKPILCRFVPRVKHEI